MGHLKANDGGAVTEATGSANDGGERTKRTVWRKAGARTVHLTPRRLETFERGSLHADWTGDTAAFSVVDGSDASDPTPVEGDFCLRGEAGDGGAGQEIAATSSRYAITPPYHIRFRFYLNDSNSLFAFRFNYIDSNNFYQFFCEDGLTRLQVCEAGTFSTLTQDNGTAIPTGEWVHADIKFAPPRLEARVGDATDSEVTVLGVTDTTHDSSGGIAIEANGSNAGDLTWCDNIHLPREDEFLIAENVGRNGVYGAHNPAAIYVASQDRTIFVWRGPSADPVSAHYDHDTGVWSTETTVGTNPLNDTDEHGPPSIAVLDNGKIFCVFGAHDDVIPMAISDNAYDTMSWTDLGTYDDPIGTYPHPVVDGDDIYIFYRTGGTNSHGTAYPAHEYATIIKSTDEGSTWTDLGPVVDTTGHPDDASDAYCGQAQLVGGDIYLAWLLAHGTGHDGDREDLFVAKYDIENDTMRDVSGTDLGSSVTWSEMDDATVRAIDTTATSETMNPPKMHVAASDDIHVVCADHPNSRARYAHWDGASWSVETVTGSVAGGPTIRLKDNGDIDVWNRENDAGVARYVKSGGSWTSQTFYEFIPFLGEQVIRNAPDDRYVFWASEGGTADATDTFKHFAYAWKGTV